jgi:hypothetical protein
VAESVYGSKGLYGFDFHVMRSSVNRFVIDINFLLFYTLIELFCLIFISSTFKGASINNIPFFTLTLTLTHVKDLKLMPSLIYGPLGPSGYS